MKRYVDIFTTVKLIEFISFNGYDLNKQTLISYRKILPRL